MAEIRLVIRAVVYTTLLMSIIIMPIAYNTYDLEVQKQEYNAQVSLLNAGYQSALVKADIELRKNTLEGTMLSLGWAFTALFYSFNAGLLEVQYQTAREQDPKTYWQKVKKFWYGSELDGFWNAMGWRT